MANNESSSSKINGRVEIRNWPTHNEDGRRVEAHLVGKLRSETEEHSRCNNKEQENTKQQHKHHASCSETGQRTTKTGEGSKLTLWGSKRRSTVAATTKNKKTTNTMNHALKQAQRRREKGRSSPCGEVEDLRIRDQEHCKQRTKGQGNQKIHKVKRIALLGSWEGERSTRGEGKASQHAPFLSKTEPMLKITKKKRKEQQMWLRTAKERPMRQISKRRE
jgi:hypothetical protein